MSEGWDRKRLGDLLTFKNGINFTRHEKGQSGVLTLDVMNMYAEGTTVKMDKLYRVEKVVPEASLLQPDDILFVRSSVKREGVAYAASFNGFDEPVSFCGFIIRGRPNEPICPDFLIHYLRSSEVRRELVQTAKTGTITNISQARLSEVEVPLPPLSVQKRIVSILDEALGAIQRAKENAQKNLANARELFESYLNREFTEKGKGWEGKRLGELLEFSNGINFTRHEKGNQGILTIDVKSMYSEGVLVALSELYRVDKPVAEGKLLKSDDILFVRSSVKREGVAWASTFTSIDEPVSYCGFIIRGRPKTAICPEFFIHFLRSEQARKVLISAAKTGTITNISQARLSEVHVPFPPLPEQVLIAKNINNLVGRVTSLERVCEQKLSALDELKQSILQKAFTGDLTAKSPELVAVS